MATDIHRIYTEELKEKEFLIDFQKMILDVSFDFMDINPQNFDNKVTSLLEQIGKFFKVDRTYVFTVDITNDTLTYSNEWCNIGIKPEVNTIEKIPLTVFPWWLDQLSKYRLVYVEDVHLMPEEARAEQEQLFRQEVKSLISVPILVDDKIHAFIGIDSVRSIKKWTEDDIGLLYIMANVISHGITHINNRKKLDFMAYHDALTGLANRSLLVEEVTKGILHAPKSLIAIMFIDLDGFKKINDNYGHDQGDKLLRQISRRLALLAGKNDCISRLAGDEFIIFYNDCKDEETLARMASNVIEVFKKPFILSGQDFFITASVGISQYPEDGNNVHELIKNADLAMYKAKNLGRNQYYICTTELKNTILETMTLTNGLYAAIKQKQMMLHYQPQVDGISGDILGVEALLRWNHPEFGFIPPSKFIPLAEKTQLIIPIGYWVLKTACEQCKEWQLKGFKPIKVAVNFSVHQLNHPKIIQQIEDILVKTSLQAKYLEIEITENLTMDFNEKTKMTVQRIKDMGVSLSIDDFGKDYSSLNRLKELPFDKLKIDMSFVRGIGINVKDEKIIKSVLLLASDLGIKTIAEGVETKEQADFLNNSHCQQMQGYYFHKPIPAHEMHKILM